MSAGMSGGIPYDLAAPTNDMRLLAPGFRAAVEGALAECNAAPPDLRAVVYETYRSDALQAVYYARGRAVRPPPKPVTNAMNNLYSWHGYGLAVDVVHELLQWDAGDAWFAKVAAIFKRHGCKWGGDWTSPDRPHFQWGLCKASPSDRARLLMRTGGVQAVWEAVGALGGAADVGGVVVPAGAGVRGAGVAAAAAAAAEVAR